MKNDFYVTNKHLTLEERELIENWLTDFDGVNITFKVIAESLAKDPTTISKEIKKHRKLYKASGFNNPNFNLCELKFQCKESNVCKTNCKHICRECDHCNNFCPKFKKMTCSKLLKPPYVCNNCSNRPSCKYEKYFYKAKLANDEYKELLVSTREGINLTYSEWINYKDILTKGVNLNQSPYHIKESNPEIPYSIPSIYRHIEDGLTDIKNVDLLRKVKYKPREKTAIENHLESLRTKGRTYADFQAYRESHPFTPIVEMDTVIGKLDSNKVLLTFFLRDSYLFLAFLIDKKNNFNVLKCIEYLYELLGENNFKNLFPVILTDNGSEFFNPQEFEYANDGKQRTKIFYCDPMRAGQKGALEQTHTLVRRIIPKGTNMDDYTQEQITLMVNHINSYYRKEINGCTPIKRAQITIKKEVLDKLKLEEIPAQQVTLKPSLLK